MDETVTNLIGLYAGLILLNTVVSAAMWWNSREDLQRDLVYVWGAFLVALVAQGVTGGVFPDNALVIVLGFSTLFGANLAFSRLISHLFAVPVPYRSSAVLLGFGLVSSVIAYALGAHFTLVSAPVAVAAAYPLLVTSVNAMYLHWSEMNLTARGMMLACLAITLHTLDYPFLRHIPEFAAMGFTIATVVVFALSIFAPAVVLEVLTKQQARVSAELDVAHRIQMKLLPREPQIPGLELACHMKPAEKVGGDYYDIYTLGDHSWILLGDVTGHGLSSGLVMLMAQSILASILHTRNEISPAELNYLANRILHQNLARLDEMRSMTIVALCRVGNQHDFVYSGNHDHLFVYRAATGEVEVLDVTQVPHDLGFLNEFPLSDYLESKLHLEVGDLLFLSTDGVVEASNKGSYILGMFDQHRVIDLLKRIANEPLPEIKRRILEELDAFTDGVYHDDVTFVLARRTGAAA